MKIEDKGETMEDPRYYIECGYDDKRCRIEFHCANPDIEDWRNAFETILTFLTYSPDTIEELFNNDDKSK